MTDREMLEFAAKATGIELRWHQDGTAFSDTRCDGYWGVWNPLADDGDALRLAVKLSMHLALFDGAQETRALADGDEWECEGWEKGKEAATRRAIVRAAAEIGKAMG